MSKFITRTIEFTKVTALAVNTETEETETVEFTLAGKYDDEKKAKKALEKLDTGYIPVLVKSLESADKLFGITPEKFMENAVELDSETRKPIE